MPKSVMVITYKEERKKDRGEELNFLLLISVYSSRCSRLRNTSCPLCLGGIDIMVMNARVPVVLEKLESKNYSSVQKWYSFRCVAFQLLGMGVPSLSTNSYAPCPVRLTIW